MADSTWSAVMAISLSVYVLAVAADRGWLSYGAELAQRLAKALTQWTRCYRCNDSNGDLPNRPSRHHRPGG